MQFPVASEHKPIEFHEGEFLVRTLNNESDLQQAYRLRHRVFAETLGWVPATEDGMEMDMYDLWGVTVGLFARDGALLGMARLLPSSGQFMLEHEFGALLPHGYAIRKATDTAEITRLAVHPDIDDAKYSSRVMLGVLKGIYQWAVENEIRYYYLEVEQRFLRALRMLGFPCEPIGPVVSLSPADVGVVAAIYDMVRFDEENVRKRPDFLEWISTLTTAAGTVVTGRTSTFGRRPVPVLA
jgi:acyl homoserine lactone synthase